VRTDSKATDSFRTMVDPDEALRLVAEAALPCPAQSVPLAEACGLQLAEPIHADRDNPPFPRAMMDGYAVRTADAGRTVRVVGEVAAGQTATTDVAEGRCLEIMTGAPCPTGTEAVVQKEQIRRDADQVTLPATITAGQHIAPQGSECKAGRGVLHPGETVTPLAIAVMASFGLESVKITPRPRLAVITTGAELIAPGEEPQPGQIRDSNGPMLVAMACDVGIDRPPHLHAQDRLEAISEALKQVADRNIILLTGGVSVGNYDLVPQALKDYGAEPVFHKVSQKPGKPLLIARKGTQLIFGLPGNPLATHFCFQRYVTAAIRQMEAKTPRSDPLQGQLAEPFRPKRGRTFFVPARAQHPRDADPGWQIHLLPGVSSADVFTSSQANCYAEVPPGKTDLPAGEVLRFTWIGNAPWPH